MRGLPCSICANIGWKQNKQTQGYNKVLQTTQTFKIRAKWQMWWRFPHAGLGGVVRNNFSPSQSSYIKNKKNPAISFATYVIVVDLKKRLLPKYTSLATITSYTHLWCIMSHGLHHCWLPWELLRAVRDVGGVWCCCYQGGPSSRCGLHDGRCCILLLSSLSRAYEAGNGSFREGHKNTTLAFPCLFT